MSERPSDRWVSISLSVLVHLAVVGALVWGWWTWKHPDPQPQQLAIEATVVDARNIPSDAMVTPAPQPEPQPAPQPRPEPVPEPAPQPEPPPPEPPPVDEKQREEEQQREKQAERDRQEQQRIANDKAAQEKAAEEKVAVAKAAKAAEEKRQREDTERRERDKADKEAKQHAAEQRLREQRENELRSQLAAEEHLNSARNSGQQAQYLALIQARIERAWIRPPSARAGLSCEVQVTQIKGGEVVGVRVGSCNGDEAVRQSIEAAVYRASPLPEPSDPALFDRNLTVTFRPQE